MYINYLLISSKMHSTHILFFLLLKQSLLSFIPTPHQEMLVWLRKKGPSTEGVFRKPCNNKTMRDIREQLNSGVEVEMESQPVVLLVGLLKVCSHPDLSVCLSQSQSPNT